MGLQLGLAMIASTTGVPEIGVDETEAKAITKAMSDLAAYYDLSATGTAGVWVGVAGTVGPIIGAHFLAYKMRVRQPSNTVAAGQLAQ
jgi:hypothetical protein